MGPRPALTVRTYSAIRAPVVQREFLNYDFAIVELETKIPDKTITDGYVRPICLTPLQPLHNPQYLTLAGFGITEQENEQGIGGLRYMDVTKIPCPKPYDDHPSFVCFNPISQKGDSGAPYFHQVNGRAHLFAISAGTMETKTTKTKYAIRAQSKDPTNPKDTTNPLDIANSVIKLFYVPK